MRLVTFQEIGSPEARLGALSPADKVIDLQERHRALFGGSPSELASMLALIEGGPAALDFARSLAASEGEELSIGKDVDRKSTRLNSSHVKISYAVFC